MNNNYKQILEAINRGIQLALDDFNDEELILKVKSKQVQNRDYTKEYLDLMNETVDLCLPSGTLWCKYNLGVDSNLLTNPENWYGNYYAWGELEANKHEFSWSTYKYVEFYGEPYTNLSETVCLTKYCNKSHKGYNQITKRWGFTDNLTELQPEDDAAYLNKKLHNYKFHIPTKEQFEELKNYTTNYWVDNYNPNKIKHNPEDDCGIQGLNGRIFEGKNGNLLFIPAAGYYNGVEHCPASYYYYCALWTDSLYVYNPNKAYEFVIGPFNISTDTNERYYGCSIRPVINL